MPIKVLDRKVISRIAAGEVVERPASVVKELVENSLDAGATEVSVEVKGGGVDLIRVSDNGEGIPSSEVVLAFERHATSKISTLEDLQAVKSLGFRGEALPSIAAVAQVELSTCAFGEQVGSYVLLEDGVVTRGGSCGRPQGTTVTVKNLFSKLPARLKFLKSQATEVSHIANVVSQYALAFPEVRFHLSIDARTSLVTPGSGKLLDTIVQVYGLEVAQNMLEIAHSSGPLKVTGMVGTPKASRSSRTHLSFFVNRRLVNSRLLSWAVEEAYHGLLMKGRHPIAVINLWLHPSEVDVNVHPTKLEVKFRNEHLVFSSLQRAVRQTLTYEMPVPRVEEEVSFKSYFKPSQKVWVGEKGARSGYDFSTLPLPEVNLPVLRLLGQIESSYLVAEGPDGLYLIDQHAAHERILFEQIKRQRDEKKVEIQGLLEPATFEVSPRENEALKLYSESLAEFGFAIEPFGSRTYLVRSIPALLSGGDWMGALRELLNSLLEEGEIEWWEKVAISLACHGAVKAGQVLSREEMLNLLLELERLNIKTCPHGRPTMICFSSERLKREFGRS